MTESARDYMVAGDHYKQMEVEPWDVIDTWPKIERMAFYRGNALKYLMRAGRKGEMLDDIKKAKHYCEKMIEVCSYD